MIKDVLNIQSTYVCSDSTLLNPVKKSVLYSNAKSPTNKSSRNAVKIFLVSIAGSWSKKLSSNVSSPANPVASCV